MTNKSRLKQLDEISITYKRSDYTNTDSLLAEALKEVFEAAEAHYRAGLTNDKNKSWVKEKW